MHDNQHTLFFLNTAAALTEMLEALDTLHTAASENTLETLNARGQAEIINLLREVAYVANETIAEIDTQQTSNEEQAFRVIQGGSFGNTDGNDDVPGSEHKDNPYLVLVAADDTRPSLKTTTMQRSGS